MARIDGQHSVDDLVGLTGLEPERLEQIVNKLAFDGALELADDRHVVVPGLDTDGGVASLEDFAAALGLGPAPAPVEEAPSTSTPEAPRPRLRKIVRRSAPMVAAPQIPMEPMPEDEEPPPSEATAEDRTLETEAQAAQAAEQKALGGRMLELEEAAAPEGGAMLLEGEEAAPTSSEDTASASKEDELARVEAERNYRQIYETRWHPLPVDARVHGGMNAHGPDLFALCFDADPRVVAAILQNMTVGLDHVRLIAFHHRNGVGLEILARRQDWLRDLLVERRLLRNPMIGEIVLGRVMGPKRLFPTYKVAIDRDIPELSRIKCRGLIRQKWQNATSEERSDLVLRTEARCLALMTGCTFDAKTTAMLCGRPINSVMFVHMISKFAASPPGLLSHLYKQPFVRKNPSLRKMLLQHPNMPADIKRQL